MKIDPDCNYLVEFMNRTIYVYDIHSLRLIRTIPHFNTISALAVGSDRLTVGDRMGKTTTYYNYNVNENKQSTISRSIEHWHSQKVESLCYERQQNYLYSGGQEGVIVLWHQFNSKRTYCPRLEGRIRYMKSLSKHLLVLLDNQILILNTANYLKIAQKDLLDCFNLQ